MEAQVNVANFADQQFYDDLVDILHNTRLKESC